MDQILVVHVLMVNILIHLQEYVRYVQVNA